MPFFTIPISSRGPIVTAAVMVGGARMQALQDSKAAVPPAQPITALIDTGASVTAVDPGVLNALGLTQTGEAEIHTPSTKGVPIKFPTFDVVIGILAGRAGDLHFISDTVQVTATELLQAQGFHALIGTDVLRKCILHYNGADGIFTLSY